VLCSIIICTRNRSEHLDHTLRSFNSVIVPRDVQAEVLVVDNGSSDSTAAVAAKHAASKIPVRCIVESTPGQTRARNTGLKASVGDVILFTDDDVRPCERWLELMVGPLERDECDAVVGRIELAKELLRPWMTERYWGGIAKYDGPNKGDELVLIGANMAFHRRVLNKVPLFDVELGPGALGFHDDLLFGWQLEAAGFRLRYIPEASVVHYAEASRLTRRSCLSERQKFGSSWAYTLYHWRHEKLPFPMLRYFYLALKLKLRRLVQPPPSLDSEGLPPWEESYVLHMETCRQYLIESRRPRNYALRGLIKQQTN
jgi:glucosyl-dolichyl phosphate glucuronosyltransferase